MRDVGREGGGGRGSCLHATICSGARDPGIGLAGEGREGASGGLKEGGGDAVWEGRGMQKTSSLPLAFWCVENWRGDISWEEKWRGVEELSPISRCGVCVEGGCKYSGNHLF